MGGPVFLLCSLAWDSTMVGVMVSLLQEEEAHHRTMSAQTAAVSARDHKTATADPCLCWRLLDTHRHVWLILL